MKRLQALSVFFSLFISSGYALAEEIDLKFSFEEEDIHYLLVPNTREIGKTAVLFDEEEYLLITNEKIPSPKITAVEGVKSLVLDGQYNLEKTISFILINEDDARDYVDAFIANLQKRSKDVSVFNCGADEIYNSLVIYSAEKKSGDETVEEKVKVSCYDYY